MKRSDTTPGSPAIARWPDLSDERLLDVRLCDLPVTLEGSVVMKRVERLHDELEQRRIRAKPHVWLSSEWFAPDGVPGIAIPFYLAHPRLIRLEEKMMLEVEGGGERECMRILRHEAGHAICSAYRLHYRKRWREVFGLYSRPYPDTYRPKPFSRNYVQHFKLWYAQAHPAEDFAETFAVWLRPGSRWRQQYRGWGALKKLEYVDELMRDIADQTPPVRSRRTPESLGQLRITLAEHYRQKRERYADDWPEFYDRDLRKIFSDDPTTAGNETAAAFLRRSRPEIRRQVAEWTGEYQYTIDQVLRDMIDRCKELKLRMVHPPEQARLHIMLMVTVQTMVYLHSGSQRFAL